MGVSGYGSPVVTMRSLTRRVTLTVWGKKRKKINQKINKIKTIYIR